ncbi:hypothetical protein Glove_103g248 [Diversispora epigaea]|uniref:Uncharacterized protein n=1 Tax=Diversispora epigaea TaxID=1348612 RepID=A0A397J6W3_9GLOM|nr:hypothetical protein Glove_103g248 [Diversispora epigaea]
MKFNQAYIDLIKQLPPSLVEESWKRLTMRKRNPLTELEACVYNRKKDHQRRSPSPLENLSYNSKASDKTHTIMSNQETQTQNTVPIYTCDHEEEIDCCVKKELDSLSRQLLEFNEKTFDPFIQEITKRLEEQDSVNNKLRGEIEQQKIKLQEAEKILEVLNMEHYTLHNPDESISSKKHDFCPTVPFRLVVAGTSESGKTRMVTWLLLGSKYPKIFPFMFGKNDKAPKNRNYRKRYIPCDDLFIRKF